MRKQSTCSVLSGPARDWRARLRALVRQAPMFETRPSLAALRGLERSAAPNAVFMGLGLCSRQRISRALPLDAFGMMMGAELVRRAAGARQLFLLVADAHAIESGFGAGAIAAEARARIDALRRIRRRLGWDHVRIVLGSRLEASLRYRRLHRELRAVAGNAAHPYVVREVADIAFFNRSFGGIVKVGWAARSQNRAQPFDERGFDECHLRWVGDPVPFAYCRAGRVLDDARPRAAPYLEHEPSRRICIAPDEDVSRKLAAARPLASEYTVRGVRNQLRVICRTYGTLVERVEGPLEERTQSIVRALS